MKHKKKKDDIVKGVQPKTEDLTDMWNSKLTTGNLCELKSMGKSAQDRKKTKKELENQK